MLIDWSSKVIQTKVVYYGPAMSGKTTSIVSLFRRLGQGDHIESIETTTGRTLFFDFGALELEQGGWKLRIYVWSATGQDYYAETRSTVLSGTDAIIFVADSQAHLLDDNVRSWQELQSFFGERLGQDIPVVLCLNKWDTPNPISRDRLASALNLSNGIPILPTIATKGHNVVEAFTTALHRIMRKK